MQRGVAKGLADYASTQGRISTHPNTCKAQSQQRQLKFVSRTTTRSRPSLAPMLKVGALQQGGLPKPRLPIGHPTHQDLRPHREEMDMYDRDLRRRLLGDRLRSRWVMAILRGYMAYHARHASRGAHLDDARLYFDGCEELELKTIDIAGIDKIAENVINQQDDQQVDREHPHLWVDLPVSAHEEGLHSHAAEASCRRSVVRGHHVGRKESSLRRTGYVAMSVRGDCLMERLGLPSSSMPPAQPAMLTRSRSHQHEADEALISSVEGSSASTSSSAPVSASSAPAAASPSTPAQPDLVMRTRGRARQEPQAQAAAQQPRAKKQKGLADKGSIAINFEIELEKSHFTSSAQEDKELRAEYHSFDMTTLGAAEQRFVSKLASARTTTYSLPRGSPYPDLSCSVLGAFSVAQSSGRKYKLSPLSASLATTRRSRFNPGPVDRKLFKLVGAELDADDEVCSRLLHGDEQLQELLQPMYVCHLLMHAIKLYIEADGAFDIRAFMRQHSDDPCRPSRCRGSERTQSPSPQQT